MKKIWKKMLAGVLILTMILGSVPVQAAAAQLDIPKQKSVVLYSSKDTNFNGSKKNQCYLYSVPGNITQLKSSKSSVASVFKKKEYGDNQIYLMLKKTGKTEISFKYKSKTYKTKITVNKYKNPIASVKVGSTILSASKFKTRSVQTLQYSKYANKKVKVAFNLAKGWEFKEIEDPDKILSGFYYFQKGWMKGSSFLKNNTAIKIKGGKGFIIAADVVNKKTGQEEVVTLFLK